MDLNVNGTNKLTLILGGARSGKSTYAEQLAAQHKGSMLYVATAQAWDEDMARRIAAHQAQRPSHWRTLEAPRNVGKAILEAPPAEVVLIDCLTLLASNVIAPLDTSDQAVADRALKVEIDALCDAFRALTTPTAHWIIVSNEVGLGIVPAYPLGRLASGMHRFGG
ncbi:bifunctional adenosylcobinamide kinase/adenosylcobinamide-phosphate guanylyltransferase [Candidatus Entotheonella serta]|nr:bifunctional adenosylcobinamide kinase/adenosylcobinamide-phosphate guanylyltransferase [Candidatus Entotheonella serta]